jgi:uncharacterized membrane protein
MPWRSQNNPTTLETVCGALSYVTFGISGLLYLLLSKTSTQSQWFRFNMYQGVFLCMLGALAGWAIGPLAGIIFGVMGAVAPEAAAKGAALTMGVVGIFSTIYSVLLICGTVMAFLRKSPEIPYISPLVRQNMMR